MGLQSLSVWTVLWLLAFSDAVSHDDFSFSISHLPIHNYTRLTEIKKHCNRFISSASKLEFGDSYVSTLKNELSFFNGDWEQDTHGATLMPFDDSDMSHATSSFITPWKLVSFEVKNVTSTQSQQPKNTISITGVLSIGITRNTIVISQPFSKFHKKPGMSALRVDFEGLYLETENESLVCLLGNSTFPFKKVPTRVEDDDFTSYFNVRRTYNEEHVILPHDQILLVLKYPKPLPSYSFKRIHGEMTSLNKKDDFEYFDKVHITSHSGISITTSEDLILESKSFDQNPLQDAMIEDGVNKFNNSEFCRILKFFEHKAYRVMPNLKLGGQIGYQDKVGPFLLGYEIQAVDRNNENLRILMHNIICKEEKVSGVLRMYPATMDPHVAARRTGLSPLTLSVKGTWNSSTGLLSMTGCVGPTLVKCDTGVLLYFPKSFSSKQRSVVSGSIFSLNNQTGFYHPVFIGLEMLYENGWYKSAYLSYNYSKSELAIEFKERSQEPWFFTYIRKSLFRYHVLEEEKDGNFKVSNSLSDDLRIDTFSSFETFVRVEVLSLGGSFITNESHFNEVSKNDVVNISMNLFIIEAPRKVKEESYRHVSKLYLEGLYDQSVGRLYLIGCRKVSFDDVELERGLDCLIEVGIEYSSLNTRWLINPTAKITIASQRNEDDNYHFKPVRLQTFMIRDKNHEKDVIFREILEGYLRVLLLLVFIAHILNQMRKMLTSIEPLAYISLAMLGLWIIGYGINLIYGKEIVIISWKTQYYKNQPYDHQTYKRYLSILDYFVRFLVLVSMVLMGKIFHMVLKARKALHDENKWTPNEKKVIVVSLCFYMGYLFLITVERVIWLYLNPLQGASIKDVYMRLIMDVLKYEVYKLQDYFMFPQIIALYVWKIGTRDNGLGSFLHGLWIPSIVLFFYDMFRDPVDYAIVANDIVL
ncbi:hypothetical protein L2E82_11900 [Cichorium intybus]|uniref:Uncharacterized protein n=1 Tax=Cichorium intybus TaxID=13427 RepID=A0ACB9GGK0_CICIN|nr:hypothetical protein L2E82_11900 [Cichorium intybus]